MDPWTPALAGDAMFQQLFQARRAVIQAQGGDLDEDEALENYNAGRRQRHQASFPINDNLMALIFTVLADLSETQRERLASTLALRHRGTELHIRRGQNSVH